MEWYSIIEYWVEGATAVVSFLGMAVCFKHGLYFRKIYKEQGDILASRLEKNFFWDAALYFVTLIMGAGLFLGWAELVKADMILRVLVLIGAVIASIRLYRHYKVIHEKNI